jgi:hypothetical protein
MPTMRIPILQQKLCIVLALFAAVTLAGPRLGAQVYAPTFTHCTTGKAAPDNPTGPEFPGQFAELTSLAPNNLEETCVWSQFAPANTISTVDMTLSFPLSINVEGPDPIAQVSVGYAGTGQVVANASFSGSSVSITIPAGTDLSTVSVTAIARAANVGGCSGTPTPPQCFEAESTIDVGYISMGPS